MTPQQYRDSRRRRDRIDAAVKVVLFIAFGIAPMVVYGYIALHFLVKYW